MQPFDYRIAVQDPLQMALAGYQQGQQFQQQRVQGERETQLYNMEMQQYEANQAKLQQEQAEAEAMQADFASFNEALIAGTATIDDVLRINARHPAIAEQVQSAFQMKSDVQKSNEIQRSLRLASLFKNAPEKGAEELKNEIAAAESVGDMERVAALKNIEATIPISPTAPITATLFSLVNLMPNEQFKTVSETLMPKAPEAASSAGKVIADYNASLFGEVGSPEAIRIRDEQLAKAGGGQNITFNAGDGGLLRTGPLAPETGLQVDPNAPGGVRIVPLQGGTAASQKETAIATADDVIKSLEDLKAAPGAQSRYGMASIGGLIPAVPGSDAANAQAIINKVRGAAFLQAFESLKGAGQITQIEGDKATQAITVLQDQNISWEFAKKAADDLIRIVKAAKMRKATTDQGGGATGRTTITNTARAEGITEAEWNAMTAEEKALFGD
jgi:hypothetical protein